MSVTINTTINGKPVSASAEASTSLLEFLRDTLEMKGTKLCCNTGECGACTVIFNGKPINSCVTLAADVVKGYFALRSLDEQVVAVRRTLALREVRAFQVQ